MPTEFYNPLAYETTVVSSEFVNGSGILVEVSSGAFGNLCSFVLNIVLFAAVLHINICRILPFSLLY